MTTILALLDLRVWLQYIFDLLQVGSISDFGCFFIAPC